MKTNTPNQKCGVKVMWCEIITLAKRVTDESVVVIGTVK